MRKSLASMVALGCVAHGLIAPPSGGEGPAAKQAESVAGGERAGAAALGTSGFEMAWFTVDAGGATLLAGGSFSLGCTSDQHDAGRLSGGVTGEIVLDAGFWGEFGGPGCTATPTTTGAWTARTSACCWGVSTRG